MNALESRWKGGLRSAENIWAVHGEEVKTRANVWPQA